MRDAAASPIVGYGDTRQQQGSAKSIAVGPTAKCKNCGQQEVGSTGQLWLLLVCDGFAGTALYIGFFGYGVWRFRRDRSPYGIAGSVVLLLGFVYMLSYDAVGAPLGFTILAYAMLWRNDYRCAAQGHDPLIPRGAAVQRGSPAGFRRRAPEEAARCCPLARLATGTARSRRTGPGSAPWPGAAR